MKRARNEKAKANRKQDILDGAEKLIKTEGLENLSIARVAKSVHLSVGTLYLYFPKKEDLIAHLTIKARAELLQKFKHHTLHRTTALDKIKGILLAYLDFCIEYPPFYELVSFYETNTGLEESEELIESSRRITDFVVEIVKEGKLDGSIRPEVNENEFSFLLWGSANGVLQLIKVKSNILRAQLSKETDDFFISFITMITNSLRSS